MDPIAIALRLIVPLSILHFPLLGGLLSMFLDGLDWRMNFFNLPNIHANYALIDKLLDFYYLSFELYVLLKVKSLSVKVTGGVLYILRLMGVISLAITGKEFFLMIFPNIFENFFLFYMSVKFLLGKKKVEANLSPLTLCVSVLILAIPKLFQEYLMHVRMMTDWRFIAIPGTPFTYDNVIGQIIIGMILVLTVVFLNSRQTNQ